MEVQGSQCAILYAQAGKIPFEDQRFADTVGRLERNSGETERGLVVICYFEG